MILTYSIYTKTYSQARTVAIQRAKSEGWTNIMVLGLWQISENVYEATVSVSK